MLACGVCRTDLHIVDGELTESKLPLVLGHQIVGAGGRGLVGAVEAELGSLGAGLPRVSPPGGFLASDDAEKRLRPTMDVCGIAADTLRPHTDAVR